MPPQPTLDGLLARARDHSQWFLERPGETLTFQEHSLAPDSAPHPGARSVSSDQPLTVLGTLGTGGMSVVRLARQESVGRLIALKGLRPDCDHRHRRRLLQEAWVTGHLEHPNVVPVHDVSAEPDGSPLILLKRIEGHTWAEAIASPALIQDLGSTDTDATVWQLNVLLAVCRAVEFAHDRGVVHRDLKPSNVMVGRFGEVTLLDWGIAVCVDETDDPDGLLPRWSPRQGVVGTPAYMAPEMLIAEHPPDARLDVYLLGATLAHVLTGRPPHSGADLEAMVGAIQRSAPVLDGPASLQALCRRAMAPAPEDRLPTVAAFREALQRCLEDRSLDQLVAAAEARLATLGNTEEDSAEDHDLEAIAGLVAACRFGFGEVLATRPDHGPARAGLDAALSIGARHALARDRPGLARAWLSEAHAVAPPLQQSLQQALDQQQQTVARAEAVIQAHDPLVARQALLLIAGAAWIATSILPALFIDFDTADPMPLPMLALPMGVGVAAASVVFLHPTWVPNRLTRAFVALLALFPALQGIIELGLRLQGVDFAVTLTLPSAIGIAVSLAGALNLDLRLGAATATYLLLWLASSTDAISGPHAVALGNSMLALCCFWVFWNARAA